MFPEKFELAPALDRFADHIWVRNKDRLDYGIPLLVRSASSTTTYPDFLWRVGNAVWAIDPMDKFILEEKLRTKLLQLPDPLRIAHVTAGNYNPTFKKLLDDGWTLVRPRMGNSTLETFDSLDELLHTLVVESDIRMPLIASGSAQLMDV